MSTAICDSDAFRPFKSLVSGGLRRRSDLQTIERFVRAVVLHDTINIEPLPGQWHPDDAANPILQWIERTEEDGTTALIMVASAPSIDGFEGLFEESEWARASPDVQLSDSLIELAAKSAQETASQNKPESEDYTEVLRDAHIHFMKRAFGTVHQGGSAVLESEFGRKAVSLTQRYPEKLFANLDEEWASFAHELEEFRAGLLIPPVLGIVLTRCANRDSILNVLIDLRQEWAEARRKIWTLLDALRASSRDVHEARDILDELAGASGLFGVKPDEFASRPLRVLWEIFSGGIMGGAVAQLSGGKPGIGVMAGALNAIPRSVPGLLHDMGNALFGRGAFDLARRVRREIQKVEMDALTRLLSNSEKDALGTG